MYFANESEDALPPETLPGIKLRKPFESMISKFNREKRGERESSHRPEKGTDSSPDRKGGIRESLSTATLLALLLALTGGAYISQSAEERYDLWGQRQSSTGRGVGKSTPKLGLLILAK